MTHQRYWRRKMLTRTAHLHTTGDADFGGNQLERTQNLGIPQRGTIFGPSETYLMSANAIRYTFLATTAFRAQVFALEGDDGNNANNESPN